MANIRVTPEELEIQGKNLVSLAKNEIEAILRQVDTQVQAICDSWDGLAQDAFLLSYQDMKEILDQFPVVVEGIGGQAISAAQRFAGVDTDLSSSFHAG